MRMVVATLGLALVFVGCGNDAEHAEPVVAEAEAPADPLAPSAEEEERPPAPDDLAFSFPDGPPRSGYSTPVDPEGTVPRVMRGEPTVAGGLDTDAVARVATRHGNELRWCYEQALPHQPELSGRLTLHFVIGSEGRTTRSEVRGSTLETELPVETCLRAAVHRWSFPAPEGGEATVDLPLELAVTPNRFAR